MKFARDLTRSDRLITRTIVEIQEVIDQGFESGEARPLDRDEFLSKMRLRNS